MKKIEIYSVLLSLCLLISNHALAIEEKLYQINGNESLEAILKKLNAPASSVLPLTFSSGNYTIKIEKQEKPDDIISLSFTPAYHFTVNDSDLFALIESTKHRDIILYNLILSHPESGRIFHLNNELKVTQLDLVTPWKTKEKLKSLKTILSEMNKEKIQLKTKKK